MKFWIAVLQMNCYAVEQAFSANGNGTYVNSQLSVVPELIICWNLQPSAKHRCSTCAFKDTDPGNRESLLRLSQNDSTTHEKAVV